MNVHVGRIYDPPEMSDGYRVLVDRLWPRGVSKQRAALDEWCKEIAPSNDLREWYGHIPDRFDGFRARYEAELARPERTRDVERFRAIAEHGPLTLLTASRAVEISEATVIAQVITSDAIARPDGSR